MTVSCAPAWLSTSPGRMVLLPTCTALPALTILPADRLPAVLKSPSLATVKMANGFALLWTTLISRPVMKAGPNWPVLPTTKSLAVRLNVPVDSSRFAPLAALIAPTDSSPPFSRSGSVIVAVPATARCRPVNSVGAGLRLSFWISSASSVWSPE